MLKEPRNAGPSSESSMIEQTREQRNKLHPPVEIVSPVEVAQWLDSAASDPENAGAALREIFVNAARRILHSRPDRGLEPEDLAHEAMLKVLLDDCAVLRRMCQTTTVAAVAQGVVRRVAANLFRRRREEPLLQIDPTDDSAKISVEDGAKRETDRSIIALAATARLIECFGAEWRRVVGLTSLQATILADFIDGDCAVQRNSFREG